MPREPNTWMWAQACEMLEQAERLHRRFFEFQHLTSARPVWEPPIDIVETRGAFQITIALPGVDRDTIEITLVKHTLVVSGTRPLPLDGECTGIHHLEIPYGRFERAIPLPPGSLRIEDPTYAHGCLTVHLRKAE